MKDFKYLRVFFMSEMVGGLVQSAVIWTLYLTVVVQLEGEALDFPTLIYDHELWVATKRMRLWIEAAEMRPSSASEKGNQLRWFSILLETIFWRCS